MCYGTIGVFHELEFYRGVSLPLNLLWSIETNFHLLVTCVLSCATPKKNFNSLCQWYLIAQFNDVSSNLSRKCRHYCFYYYFYSFESPSTFPAKTSAGKLFFQLHVAFILEKNNPKQKKRTKSSQTFICCVA